MQQFYTVIIRKISIVLMRDTVALQGQLSDVELLDLSFSNTGQHPIGQNRINSNFLKSKGCWTGKKWKLNNSMITSH